jgi:signal peptidase I
MLHVENPQPNEGAKRNPWLRGKRLVLLIAGLIVLALIIRLAPALVAIFVVQPVRIEGQAMRPPLNDGNRVLISKRS